MLQLIDISLKRGSNQLFEHLTCTIHPGHKVGMVADMWAGDDKDKPWVWNPKLRKIKRAMAEDARRAGNGTRGQSSAQFLSR